MKLRVNSSVRYQNKNEVASVIGRPVTQFCCSLIRWQDRWLIAQGRWHCTPSLCWCVGGTASPTPISTAASSLPWRSLRFWSLLSERGLGKVCLYFGFLLWRRAHWIRFKPLPTGRWMYCTKHSRTVSSVSADIHFVTKTNYTICSWCWGLEDNRALHKFSCDWGKWPILAFIQCLELRFSDV